MTEMVALSCLPRVMRAVELKNRTIPVCAARGRVVVIRTHALIADSTRTTMSAMRFANSFASKSSNVLLRSTLSPTKSTGKMTKSQISKNYGGVL